MSDHNLCIIYISQIAFLAAADDAKLMQQQMSMGGGMVDTKKLYKSEKENLELVDHKWHVEEAEKRLLEKQKLNIRK